MMNNIEFDELPEFKKDLKHLLKKYRTLKEDLEVVKLDLNDEPGEEEVSGDSLAFGKKNKRQILIFD